jgi:rhomboid protease GluP
VTAPVQRIPWLTIGVFVVTGAVTGAQFAWPGLIPALQRQPSMIERWEVWRFVTAWLVHDGGWSQIVFNFAALASVGTMVELNLGRMAWMAAYLAGGLTGEIAGIFWQPVGAGNSVAICGLAGLLAAFQAMRSDLPMLRRFVWPGVAAALALYLVGSANIHGLPIIAGAAVGIPAWRRDRQRHRDLATASPPGR